MARARSWNVIVMVIVVLLGHSEVLQVRAVAQVAQFIFGDSLVDQGNNNNLNSIAKANFRPNGVDLAEFDYLPTGRFSNGRLVSDFISAYMGTEPVATYAEATEQDLLRGANFASAGSGILDDTGNIFLGKIPINQQIANFQSAKSQLESQIGQAATDQLLAKAIFAFTTGGNDFITYSDSYSMVWDNSKSIQLRLRVNKYGMLWLGKIQWTDSLQCTHQFVSRPHEIPLLGSLPSLGESK